MSLGSAARFFLQLLLLIFGDVSSAVFTPSISAINSSIEFHVPLNANISISYFDDSGVFITSSRVITQKILDDAIAFLKIDLMNDFNTRITSSALQETSALNSESSIRYNADMSLSADLRTERPHTKDLLSIVNSADKSPR